VDAAKESVMEDVKEVVEYAKAENFYNSPPGKGDREVFVAERAEKQFSEQMDYMGVAANLFSLDLTKWAVKGQVVPKHAVCAYGRQYMIPAARSQETFKILKDPVGVAVLGKSPGARGTWRRISLDLQTFAFIVCFADLIRKKPHDPETKQMIEQFKKAALNCPMKFYYFEPSGDLDIKVFKKSFEIMEQYRKAEEVHAPGGWQVCCLFHAAKELQSAQAVAAPSQAPGPSPSKKEKKEFSDALSVCSFFADFTFAETSEFNNLGKK